MITIEEKLKLFTKIIYDKVEKQNQSTIEKFNNEFGSLLSQKRQEFEKQAEDIKNESEKNIQKEKVQIISKARIEEKRIILENRKEMFDELVNSLLEYCRAFVDTEEYKVLFLSDFKRASGEMEYSNSIEIITTSKDYSRFKKDIDEVFKGKNISYTQDDDIIGGFILVDTEKSIRMDMSMPDRILSSKEYIGEKLFEALQ